MTRLFTKVGRYASTGNPRVRVNVFITAGCRLSIAQPLMQMLSKTPALPERRDGSSVGIVARIAGRGGTNVGPSAPVNSAPRAARWPDAGRRAPVTVLHQPPVAPCRAGCASWDLIRAGSFFSDGPADGVGEQFQSGLAHTNPTRPCARQFLRASSRWRNRKRK